MLRHVFGEGMGGDGEQSKFSCQVDLFTNVDYLLSATCEIFLLVIAPGGLRAIEVDMESVTDTFMTAAAVMATAQGTSRIYNIANQRVKECDRIAATVRLHMTLQQRANTSREGISDSGQV